jgi:hypothetical protein
LQRTVAVSVLQETAYILEVEPHGRLRKPTSVAQMIGELLNSLINSRGRRCCWRRQFPTVSKHSQQALQARAMVVQMPKTESDLASSNKRFRRLFTDTYLFLPRMIQPDTVTPNDRNILSACADRESLGSEMRCKVIHGLLA